MTSKKNITVDDLWALERLGAPSLSPDGAQVVCTLSTPSMKDNKLSSALWLLSTLGGQPRRLTQAGDKDGQAQFSPRADLIGFVAKREQEGQKDEEPQFYVIPPDGGEARRVGQVATGVSAFKWFPDGKRIAFVSWIRPALKGQAAQTQAHKAFKARQATGLATSDYGHRFWDHVVQPDQAAHLLVMDLATGKVIDLFEGSGVQLSRFEPDQHSFDISPDGKRIVFSHDPDPSQRIEAVTALSCVELRGRRITTLAQDIAWDLSNPRYSPDGQRIALLASHQGLKHTMPRQLAVLEADGRWDVVSATWDHEVQAPLLWEEDGQALLFCAEQQGRRHLWRFDLPDRRAEVVAHGQWISAFDKAAGTVVTLTESAAQPPQMQVHLPGEAAQRIERFNNATLAGLSLGRSEEVWVTGALGDKVQMWLHYPPGFDPKKKYPVLHSIHGGPHTTAGDNWHVRWNNQVFAAQGYVVACVNYHGSSSFGHAFLDSITHRWGELELQDVEACTDWLLKKPWTDKRRVFASGGSYGGFMVAWMNGHVKAGRYAAYICHAGCFDWTAMVADDAYSWHAKELGAWYWAKPEQVDRQSPRSFAQHFNTPTLVIHGALDYRVPDAQGLAYYNTLKARGLDARLLWYPDENHWILKPANSKLWYEEFFAWLKGHDAPAGARQAKTAKPAKPARRTA
jgi:dipeptidyl aminopeptidase/acylaminoacyl peptidase